MANRCTSRLLLYLFEQGLGSSTSANGRYRAPLRSSVLEYSVKVEKLDAGRTAAADAAADTVSRATGFALRGMRASVTCGRNGR